MTTAESTCAHVTCLGCGCACDDIEVRVRDGRIVETVNTCTLGSTWFGDGQVPWRALIQGRESTVNAAIDAVVGLLADSTQPLVYLAPELSCQTQREAVALADLLGASIDSVTSATTLDTLLATQERGRATATLGEIRNRADVIVWWGVDPAQRYPRFTSRYAPLPAGIHVPSGRASRVVIAVDVGDARGPVDADRRVAISPHEEHDTLTRLIALASGDGTDLPSPADPVTGELDRLFRSGRYVAIVADAEPDPRLPHRDAQRPSLLIALSQALNGPTRCALSLLRAGGNRTGADAVLTWQTGYPVAVDFSRAYPRYRPHDGSAGARLTRANVDAMLVLGSVALVPADLAAMMGRVPSAVIGPRATEGPLSGGIAAIDTGLAGVHEEGMALRMDDVPVRLRAPLGASTFTQTITRALSERIVTRQRNAGQGPGAPVLR